MADASDQFSRARVCKATALRRVSAMLADPSAATTTGAPVQAAGVPPVAAVKLKRATLQ